MAEDDRYRKYFEAASVLGQITRARAEEMMREMMSGGEEQRANVQRWLDELIDRSRRATGGLIEIVRAEVANHMNELGLNPDDLARQAAEILRRASRQPGPTRPRSGADGGAAATTPAARPHGTKKKAPAKKAAPTKGLTKKAAAEKTTKKRTGASKAAKSKKGAVKRAAPKKAGATKAAAKRPAGGSPSARS